MFACDASRSARGARSAVANETTVGCRASADTLAPVTDSHAYPPLEPFDTGELAVTAPHVLYYEQCGKPDGEPMLFLHGGPGAGCTTTDRRFFDPEHFGSCCSTNAAAAGRDPSES